MTDLVERLREQAEADMRQNLQPRAFLATDAAAEIERLRGEVKEQDEAMLAVAKSHVPMLDEITRLRADLAAARGVQDAIERLAATYQALDIQWRNRPDVDFGPWMIQWRVRVCDRSLGAWIEYDGPTLAEALRAAEKATSPERSDER